MKFSIQREDKYIVFKLEEKKLDSIISPELKSEFQALHSQGVENVILDMSAVEYSDSSGLSAILVGNRLFTNDSSTFIISSISEHVKKLVKISQLDKVLYILPTVEESVEAIFLHIIGKGLIEEEGENE